MKKNIYIFLLFVAFLFLGCGFFRICSLYLVVHDMQNSKQKILNEKYKFKVLNDSLKENLDFIETRMRFIFADKTGESFFWKDECGEVFDVFDY